MRLANIILMCLIFSCTHSQENEALKTFKNTEKLIPAKLVEHFPKIEFNPYTTIIAQQPVNSEYNEGLELEYFTKKEHIDNSFLDSIKTHCLESIYLEDSCMLIVDRPYNGGSTKLTECQENNYPLPNIPRWYYSFGDKQNYIPKDLIFYVLDAKPGNYLPDSLLTNGGGLPERWRNGYSKGICISQGTGYIVYWLVVW